MAPLQIMSFNVRGASFDDGPNRWPARAALNLAAIRTAAPDIIGFQECEMGNHVAYRAALPTHAHHLGWPVDQPSRFLYNAIAWRRERFTLENAGSFYLSRSPRVWSKDWDAALVRGANWVRLEDQATGRSLLVLNAHLDHQGATARLEAARLLARQAIALAGDLPIAVTGDFNSPAPQAGQQPSPASPYGALHAAGFADSFAAAGPDEPVATYHGFRGGAFVPEGNRGPLRIDWILTRGPLQSVSYRIVDDAEPPLYPSDHFPVLATLQYQ